MSKLDMFDGILKYSEIGKQKNVFPVIYDYPETVQQLLWEFVSAWGIPEEAIPRKPRSGKGGYAEWISEISDLESLMGTNPQETMKSAVALYAEMKMNFMIVRPRAIRSVLIELKRRGNVSDEKKKIKSFSDFMDGYENKGGFSDSRSFAKNLKKELKGE